MRVYRGHYFDGRSATRWRVGVIIGAEALYFQDADGTINGAWALKRLRPAGAVLDGQPLQIKCADAGAARLVVPGRGFAARLELSAPDALRRKGFESGRWRHGLPAAAVVLGMLAAGYYTLPLLVAPVARLIPQQWAVAWGDAILDSLFDDDEICAADDGARSLAALGARLETAANLPHAVDLRVYESGQVNAFTLPGGHIALLKGLIDEARSADEVAGVLAHELGHVAHRHPLEGAVRQFGLGVITDLMGSGIGQYGGEFISLTYSRDDEREADRAALDLLDTAGVSAAGLADFFDRLDGKRKSVGGFMKFLSSHPLSRDRALRFREFAQRQTATSAILSDRQWRALQHICAPAPADEAADGE